MASRKFVKNLTKQIKRKLRKVIDGEPQITVVGPQIDQWKGYLHDLKCDLNPFKQTEIYQATEQLVVAIPVKDPHFDTIHFTTPVINIRRKSIQGIGSFVVHVPYPIKETYMAIPASSSLVPITTVLELNTPQHLRTERNAVVAEAVKAMSKDRKVKLFTPQACTIEGAGLSNASYKISFNPLQPPGRFSIIPYKGNSVMIMREAGGSWATEDAPCYDFRKAQVNFSRCAEHLHNFPERGELIGRLFVDRSFVAMLAPILAKLDEATGQSPTSGNL